LKIDSNDMLDGTSFFILSDKVALLMGKTNAHDLRKLSNWAASLHIDGEIGTLLIDSDGGVACPGVLEIFMKANIRIHVLGMAGSFAGVLALTGSIQTASSEAVYMFHASRWRNSKHSESVARDEELLERHNYRMLSLVASLLPAGEVKRDVIGALEGEMDIFYKATWLAENGVVDAIIDVTAEDLGLEGDIKVWYNRKYGRNNHG